MRPPQMVASGTSGDWLPPSDKVGDLAVAGAAILERTHAAGRLVAPQDMAYAVVILPSHSPPAGTDACWWISSQPFSRRSKQSVWRTMTCLVAPVLSTMCVLCTVQTRPTSPLTLASNSRMSTWQDSKLAKVSSNSFLAGATPRDANGGMSNHSTSDAQCRVSARRSSTPPSRERWK